MVKKTGKAMAEELYKVAEEVSSHASKIFLIVQKLDRKHFHCMIPYIKFRNRNSQI
jgi:hypothetical protein